MSGRGAGSNGRVTPGSAAGTLDPVASPALPTDPVGAAKQPGCATCRTSSRDSPQAGRQALSYLDLDGRPIKDEATLKRIKSLAIPPAWTDVWICPHPQGHIQATGRDAKGRKQYRYHPDWQAVRDETKYGRLIAFGEALPRIRRRSERDLARPALPREKVLATVVRLLEETHIRVGNEEYEKQNKSYGLTTLHNRHVEVNGSTIRFRFKGKSGINHEMEIATGGWPRSSASARTCRGRSCSSTSTRTVRRTTSARRT